MADIERVVGDLNTLVGHIVTVPQDNKIIDSVCLYPKDFIPLSAMVIMVKCGP